MARCSTELISTFLLRDSVIGADLYYQISRNLIGVAVVRLVNIAVVFLTSVLLARTLGPADYGDYAFIMSVCSSLALLCYLGMPEFLTREIVKFDTDQKRHRIRDLVQTSGQTAVMISVALLIMVVTTVLIFSSTETNNRWNLLLIALPMLPAIALTQLAAATLKGFQRVVLATLPDLIVRPSLLLAAIAILNMKGYLSTVSALAALMIVTYFTFLTAIILSYGTLQGKLCDARPFFYTDNFLRKLLPFSGLAAVSFFNIEFVSIYLGLSGNSSDLAIFRVAASFALFVSIPLTLLEASHGQPR